MKKIFAASVTSILFAALFFGAMPTAMAGIAEPEGHNILFNPVSKIISLGGIIQSLIGVPVPQAVDITGVVTFHLEDIDASGAAASTNPSVCAAQAFSGAFGLAPGDIQTVLVDSGQLPALVPVIVTFTGTNNAGPGAAMQATINTGPVGAANPVVSTSPGVVAYYLVGNVKTPLVGNPVWVQTIGPNAADGIVMPPAAAFGIGNTNLNSQQNVISCGCDDGDSNGSCADSVDNPGVVSESYQLQDIVGGFFMDVSSSSLIVAGAQANALWILPILGLAGTLIAIRKLEA